MLLQTILEGLGLGALLTAVGAVGIRKGAVGMVHTKGPGAAGRNGWKTIFPSPPTPKSETPGSSSWTPKSDRRPSAPAIRFRRSGMAGMSW